MWVYLVIGLLAGTIVSSWQGYKDPPWEGFVLTKFLRSILVGGVIGIAAFMLQSRHAIMVDNLGLLLLTMLATERLVGETYKGFLRPSAHPEYFKLFRRLHLPLGHPVLKVTFGLAFLAGGLWLYWLFGKLGGRVIGMLGYTPPAGVVIGFAAGLMAATGGALKDSQFEGFKPLKFVRSPIMSAIGGAVLVGVSRQPLLISLGAVGFERVVVEFYKTFIRRQVRGIHEHKPLLHPEWLQRRHWFMVSFLACVAVCAALLAG